MGEVGNDGKSNSAKPISLILLSNPLHVLPLYCFCMAYCKYIGQSMGQCPNVQLLNLQYFLAHQGPQDCVMNFLLCFMFEIELRNNKIGTVN